MSEVSITGIGGIPVDRVEYLNRDVLTQFTGVTFDSTGRGFAVGGGIYALQQILEKGARSNYQYTPTVQNQQTIDNSITVQDYNTIINTISQIAALAREGVEVTTLSGTYRSYLNGDMVQILDDVMKSLKAAGIDYPPPNNPPDNPPLTNAEKINAVKAWNEMAGFGVYDILSSAIKLRMNAEVYTDPSLKTKAGELVPITAFPTKTFTSMLEVDYIKDGNEILSNNLFNLQDALEITKKAIDTLSILQTIYNQLQVLTPSTQFYSTTLRNALYVSFSTRIEYDFAFSADDINSLYPTIFGGKTIPSWVFSSFRGMYKSTATIYFAPSGTQPIVPMTIGVSARTAREIFQAKLDLSSVRGQLLAINPTESAKSTSLAGGLLKVIKDISAQFAAISYNHSVGTVEQLYRSTNTSVFNGLFTIAAAHWIMDNQTGSPTSKDDNGIGKIGDRLTQAIKNAESLNDDQRGKVRQYLHLFEEFYKSAVNMLELLGQLFSKINGNVSKS